MNPNSQLSNIACPVANMGCALVPRCHSRSLGMVLARVYRTQRGPGGPMFPTIPNDCHPLDDLLWRILGNCTLNVIGDSTKLEAVKVSQGGIGRSAWKKTKGHSFSIFIQSLQPKPATVV